MTVFVTGGAGFIGSNFILNWLETTQEKIINIDKLTYAGNLDNLRDAENNPLYRFVQSDIADQKFMTNLLATEQPRAIFNFAAESHVDRSITGPEEFIQTNIVGTFRLLEAAKNYWLGLDPKEKEVFRFLHVSTDEVYGSLSSDAAAFTEQHKYEPNSPYSASKASSDHMVRAYYHTYGLPVLTTNCSNNYGPHQFPEKLIPLIISNILAGKDLPIYGDGQQIRDWLFVKDHCTAIQTVLEKGRLGEVYNVGGNAEKTNLSLVHLLCELLDELAPAADGKLHKELITYVTDRLGHDRRYAVDTSKIMAELGWKPQETFESGIRKTVEWYLQHTDWVSRIQSGDYQHQEQAVAA